MNWDDPIISEFEKEIIDFLDCDFKNKNFFLSKLYFGMCVADLIGKEDRNKIRMEVIVRFFTLGYGKIYMNKLPDHIRNKILAYSL